MVSFRFQIIESLNAVEIDGKEDKEIEVSRGGFLARLFDPDPTLHLWDKTKKVIIKVPHYKPVIYRLFDKIIVHPSLMPEIKKQMTMQDTAQSKYFNW